VAVTISKYDNFLATLTGGTSSGGTPIDWLSDTIKISLHTTTYTPALTTHDFYDDITNELATGNGYTTGGDTLASKTTSSPAAGVVTYDCADNVWTFSAAKSFRYGVIRKDTGTASTSPLMFLIDFDGSANLTAAIGTWTWVVNASGLFTIS
jgi:hypothetical protein